MNKRIYTVDVVEGASGLVLALSFKKMKNDENIMDNHWLRLPNEFEVTALRSRYSTEAENPLHQLENHLIRLSQAGELGRSEIIFGYQSDPFHPFAGKFDFSIKALELFTRYIPGHLTVQTRSPLLVIALPVLKRLGKKVSVSIGIETPDEKSVARYTPGLPRVEERLKLATALRRFEVPVSIQVAPVLPYGDWKNDAACFAKALCEISDHIFILPFNTMAEQVGISSRAIKNHGTVVRLAEDRKFHWLRADSATPLISAIEAIDKKKLIMPLRSVVQDRQLSMFAA